jgi:SAM-dependent methyltransferase
MPQRVDRTYPARVTGPTDVTLATYEEGVEAYLAASPGVVGPAIAELLDALVEHVQAGRILELGSGPGREADYLEQRGLAVDRTDATPAFVARLQRAGHHARLLDVRSGDLGGPYDAVLANAVLLHLERDEMEKALRACHAATRPGGLFAITLKEGDGEAWSEAKLGTPRWFVYWRPQPLRAALEGAGWEVHWMHQVEGRVEP